MVVFAIFLKSVKISDLFAIFSRSFCDLFAIFSRSFCDLFAIFLFQQKKLVDFEGFSGINSNCSNSTQCVIVQWLPCLIFNITFIHSKYQYIRSMYCLSLLSNAYSTALTVLPSFASSFQCLFLLPYNAL